MTPGPANSQRRRQPEGHCAEGASRPKAGIQPEGLVSCSGAEGASRPKAGIQPEGLVCYSGAEGAMRPKGAKPPKAAGARRAQAPEGSLLQLPFSPTDPVRGPPDERAAGGPESEAFGCIVPRRRRIHTSSAL